MVNAWHLSAAHHRLAALRALHLEARLTGYVWYLMPTFRADALPVGTGCIGSPHTTRPVSSSLSAALPAPSSSTSKHGYTSCYPSICLTHLKEHVICCSPECSRTRQTISERDLLNSPHLYRDDHHHDRDERARYSPGRARPGSCRLRGTHLIPFARFRIRRLPV